MATLVTCATGFVSRAFVRALRAEGEPARVLIRDPSKKSWFPDEEVIVGDVFDPRCLAAAVSGMDAVIHVPPALNPGGDAQSQLALHRWSQVESTRRVLDRAAMGGVGKFLFISSAHATGRSADRILCEVSDEQPDTPYGRAKREAEELIRALAERCRMKAVILRPPDIYGPGDKSIITSLQHIVRRNLWLPLKGIEARHSMIFADNLARAGLELLAIADESRPSVFIVKDAVDYRAEDLYASVCRALGKPPRVFRAPGSLLRIVPRLGRICRGIPKLGWLEVLRQLMVPRRYCGHLFANALPNFVFVDLDEAIQKTVEAC